MCILPFYRASEIMHGCKIALFGSEQIIKTKTQWLIIFKTFDKSINKLSFFSYVERCKQIHFCTKYLPLHCNKCSQIFLRNKVFQALHATGH